MSNHGEFESRVRAVVAQIANVRDPSAISGDKDLYRDIGVQSTAALELLLTLEEEFEIVIPDEAFGEARTVSLLTQLIAGLAP